MRFKPKYILAFAVYVGIIVFAYYFFGLSGGALAGVAGIVAPAIGFLLSGVSPDTENTESRPEPERKQDSFVETLGERRERAKSRLNDLVILRENKKGEIETNLDREPLGGDREAMLYVFGQWAKADEDAQSTPIVTKQEIRENTCLKGGAVRVFLGKMAHFIERHYPEDYSKRREMDEGEIEFELNEDYLEEIVDYILSERRAPD